MSDSVLTPTSGDPPVPVPKIGVGITVPAIPSVTASSLSRYRVRTARAGVDLRAGETVLCAPYEPALQGLVVLVRCETDGYSPGVLIPAATVEYLGPAPQLTDARTWSTPGARPTAPPG
jgi:hypothetical protein